MQSQLILQLTESIFHLARKVATSCDQVKQEKGPTLSLLGQEEQQFQLREAEPMALINKKTNARIRSTADMPVPQKHLDDDWARALVVRMSKTVHIVYTHTLVCLVKLVPFAPKTFSYESPQGS